MCSEASATSQIFNQAFVDQSKDHVGGNQKISKSVVEALIQYVRPSGSGGHILSENHKAVLSYVTQILLQEVNAISIKWFPKYRCALIAKRNNGCNGAVRTMTLLGLENYEFEAKLAWNANFMQTCETTSFTTLPIESVVDSSFSEFMDCFQEEYSHVIKQDRAKKLNRHKKLTPAFVALILTGAHIRLSGNDVSGVRDMEAGWSEVLHHSGCDWALLNAVIEYISTSIPITTELIAPVDHHRFVCHFQMWLLSKEMDVCFSDEIMTNARLKSSVNRVVTMMTVIARKAVDEILGVLSVEEIEKQLQQFREKLSQKVLQHWQRNATNYQLNLGENLNITQMSMQNLSELQSVTSLYASMVNLNNSNRRAVLLLARSNTDLVPLFQCQNLEGLESYLSHLESLPNSSELFSLSLTTSTVQNIVYKACSNLNDPQYEVDVEKIGKLVNIYRQCNRKVIELICQKGKNGMKSRLVVEMLSEEMLIMWSFFCLAHNFLKQKESLLKRYAVPLEWTDIAHLVVSKKNAQKAALEVSAYLKLNSNGCKLFDLSYQSGTLKFAYEFASESSQYLDLWAEEQNDAKKRQNEHWRIVQQKKTNVEKLQCELNDLQCELNNLESKYDQLYLKRQELHSYDEDDEHEIKRVERKLESKRSSIALTKEKIRQEKKAPHPVFQPLPKESRPSLTILFFLHIPRNLEVLARLAISAQQILRPVKEICQYTALGENEMDNIDKMMQVYGQCCSHWTAWVNYYDSHSSQRRSSCSGVLHPYFTYVPPNSNKVGPRDVMLFSSREDGVWRPFDENPILLWNGGGFNLDHRTVGFFNPFVPVRKNLIIEYFTEKVLQENVQYVVTQYGELTEKSRSNQGIAQQNEKPNTLNKPQWLTASSLRAYPNQQLRKLRSSLCDRNLKLDDPLVQILIRQTLFQIGDVVFENEEVIPVWKTDMFNGEFCDVISVELKNMGSELAAKPSQHKSLLMLIEIARYVGQWSDACVEVLRDYLTKIKSWIAECQEQIAQAAVCDTPTLRGKLGLFYHYAILCYSAGELSESGAGDLCKLLVQAQNETCFEDSTPYDSQLQMIVNTCCEMMAERIMTLVSFGELNNGGMLTDAVREISCETPRNLMWRNLPEGNYKSCCFEAVSICGNLYTVNLSNGVVLINGRPLSALPASVLRHPLYKKTFGDRNFKISLENRVMKTAMPIKGRIYSFMLLGSSLTVIEKDSQTNVELRLLDSSNLDNKNSWGFELPVILKENYGHWYCESKKALLFRGHSFLERSTDFLMIFTHNEWRCFRIPSHKTSSLWNQYLTSPSELSALLDQLVSSGSSTKTILEKFEEKEYIHTYKSPDGTISFHYPRFDLEFRLVLDSDRSSTVLHSRDYTGYVLSPCQQLSDTLWGFDRYLVLQHAMTGESDTKIVIPRGEVVSTNGEVLVETESCSGAKLAVYAYDVHPRFKCLLATSIHARIHLAHLYAASETLLPEERMKMCGSEVAMQLIRRSWTNQPLELTDYKKLQSIPETAMASPGLALLCYEVSCSSLQTEFLHTERNVAPDFSKMGFPTQASNIYMHERFPRNVRSSLTAEEEIRVLGAARTRKVRKRLLPENVPLTCAPDCIERKIDWADKFEKLLVPFIDFENRQSSEFIFNLHNSNGENGNVLEGSKLYAFMMRNLKESHDAHYELEDMKLKDGFADFCPSLVDKVARKRRELQCALFEALTKIPDECGSVAASFRMFRSANLNPILTCEDLVRCAFDREWIQNFNPFLSPSCFETVLHNIKLWLKLCVLEDKLARLRALLYECNEAQQNPGMGAELRLLQELEVYRTWSVDEHPQWLAFEVIAQLQIRPIQYTIAKTMIEGVENGTLGPVTQLNMGEGKTRVILPMLVMHWRNSDKLVRLNFLTPLLQEAFEYMHNVLCASIIGILIFHHPFNRDVKLTCGLSRTYVSSLKHCQKLGGVLVCSPEHRLSLKLKFFELKQAGASEVCHILKEIDSFKYLDILDEVDEILRTKNKLIYAIGSQEQLTSKESRWNVLQGLLKVIGSSSKIQKILSQPLVTQGEIGLSEAKFQEFRILPGELFEGVRVEFLKMLVQELVSNPPFELRWLSQLNANLIAVLDYVTKPDQSELLFNIPEASCLDDVLALRGFLASGLFVHCFMKRNRVDYGVNRRASGKKKLMAVPFHACETPALRAEFGHPDCALMYTCLAYYYDGLDSAQVEQAFRTLLSLGESAQADIYRTWFELSSVIMESDHKTSLDSVRKLDLSNSVLVSLLVNYFSFNIFTINFWLNSIIFPVGTVQFPHRLEATAWDIAHNSQNKVAGFSGTNDERVIMPSSLKWIEQCNLSLVATDGKMLQLLLKSDFEAIDVDESENRWKAILDIVVAKTQENGSTHTRAFIDAGALMAGATDNEEVALYLIERLGQNYKGIVYFDLVKNGWWVRDKYGRAWPKHSSPIHERDGFVYFDESRTRGADMKLSINSRAVLTLGPQMCKDKLMQAAGRMRMLEHGQKLVLMATKDASSKIKRLNGLENANSGRILPVHVLKWVLTNTVNNVAKWLPEWAIQGAHFITKSQNPSLVLSPDMTKLDQMYAHELQEKPVLEIWERRKKDVFLEGSVDTLTEWNANLLTDINTRITEYGGEFLTKIGSNMEEELERELEKEIEIEEEIQIEIPKEVPRNEVDWNVSELLRCSSAEHLKRYASLLTIEAFVNNYIRFKGSTLNVYSSPCIEWPSIYGTENFFLACEISFLNRIRAARNIGSSVSYNEYLRMIDHFLVFLNGDLVLISEREADNVLKLTWNNEMGNFAMMSLTYARRRLENGRVKFQTPFLKEGETVTAVRKFEVKDDTLAALALFQGLVMFSNFEKSSLEKILASDWAKEFAPSFCAMRGLGFSYSRSDLEILCTHQFVD